MPTHIYFKRTDEDEVREVDDLHPLPVEVENRLQQEGALPVTRTAVAADINALVGAEAGLRLLGFSCRESDGTPAAATFRIMRGPTVAGGDPAVFVELAANESTREWPRLPGVNMEPGISIDHIAGTFDLTVFIGQAL